MRIRPQYLAKIVIAVVFLFAGIQIMRLISDIRKLKQPQFSYPPSFQKGQSPNTSRLTGSLFAEVPSFVFYVRLTYNPRSAHEYRNVLIRSMKLFVSDALAKLVVVLDHEKPEDHNFGDAIKKEWPYPDICYMPAGDPTIYYGRGKARMYWDMMRPDLCTSALYVGFLDGDTMFDTLVTPQLLFESNKPVIIAKIGLAPYACWVKSTERFLGKKEVMQCMSAFPITVKTTHMIEMRKMLSRQSGKDFRVVFRQSAFKEKSYCICQFSYMCNYLWYNHRDEYSWHLQTLPNGNWNGEDWRDGQVNPEYYQTDVKPDMKIPIPRTSVHLRYTLIDGVNYLSREPPKEAVNDIIKEGLCYSAGFEYCPHQCKKWKQGAVQYHLYSFEFYQWFWDKRCKKEQEKHYKNVKKIVRFSFNNKLEIFGVSSIEELCKTIEEWKYY